MGLLGWVPPFHGNPQAGKSGLGTGNYGPQYLGREKRNFLWVSCFLAVVLCPCAEAPPPHIHSTEKLRLYICTPQRSPAPASSQKAGRATDVVEEDH